ncbi:hypothetical protein CTEN210_12108 [Chaetoceros tenuissimus]|uniref:Ionotropic glutamate receptor C-terminal domain-containing protein n=1 Tax=Chaetoceros tenuissimus TaxID=426638 RepID=A0AAD3D0K4_9STRA|nr:hypothetical protein CTEN210_12108 [Chaetoceros tenuissimus]
MSANWWFDTLTRISLGASFPKGWLDGSLIIVTIDDDRQDEFQPFSWAKPFTWTVWVAIITTLVVSALISALVEGRSRRNEAIFAPFEGSVVSTLLSYLHQAFLVVTGHLDLIPNTHAGQLVSLSMSFFAMLLLSAYTANLASFLVVERTSARLAVNTVNDIVQARQSICVWGGTPVEEEILALYENAMLVTKVGDDGVLKGVRDGECNFGVVALSSYELFQGKEEVNTDCNLIRVGRNFKTYENGLAVKADAGTLCTSLVRDMLNVHMKDLFEEGYIDELWKDLYREKHDVEDPTCFDETVISDTNSDTLNLTNVIGIFMVHGGLLFLALLVYILERYLRKRKKLNGRDSTRADILRHSQFQRHSLNAHTQFTSSNSIEGDHESTETAVLSEKVDVIESKVLGMESKMEDMATTLSEILKAVKQEQPVNVYDSSNRKSYTKQDTTDTARSSIQYDLGGNGDYEERFDDDNFSYDTNAVFR